MVEPLAGVPHVLGTVGVFGVRDLSVVCKDDDHAALCKVIAHVPIKLQVDADKPLFVSLSNRRCVACLDV